VSEQEKEKKEVDIASLDPELAAAKKEEANKGSVFLKLASAAALLMALFHVYTVQFGLLSTVLQRGIHFAFAATVLYLIMPLHDNFFGKKFAHIKAFRIGTRLIDIAIIIAVWVALWMANDEVSQLTARIGRTTILATISGGILLVAILEGARRALGWVMPILAGVFIGYAMAGPWMPHVFLHRGFSFTRILDFLSTDLDGVFGAIMGVSATIVFMFIMFGAFVEASGCSKFFNDLAFSLTAKSKAGPAMASVVATSLMATISGSAIANVMATGPFTIPMMKDRGYRPAFAAAVEASASTGGQILPPIMGAGAFLMVAFTNTPFVVIAISALIPAVLYFVGSGAAVVAQANILDIKVSVDGSAKKAREVLKSDWLYITIFVVLIYFLMVMRVSPMRSALWATTFIPFVMLLDRQKRFKFKDIIPAMIKGSKNAVTVVMGIACASIVVAVVALTGVGVMFGDIMIGAAGGNLILVLIFSAIACIILGLGLPTTSAYVITASVVAPSLYLLGVDMIAAHMFVFYFACLSAITPPVALAAYSAGALAKISPMAASVEACKLAIVGFIVPFAFVFNGALFLQGGVVEIATTIVFAVSATIVLTMGFQGWLLWRLNILERLIFILCGGLMFAPFILVNLGGLGLVALMLVLNMRKWKKGKNLAH